MWLKVILLQTLFNYLLINCEQGFKESLSKDSIALQNLYEKLQQNCRNPKELNAIKELTQIINDIKQFESQLSEIRNGKTQLKIEGLDERASTFITKVLITVIKLVDIRNVVLC